MYPNFNYQPNFRPNMPNRPNRPPYDDDRLIGGGFAFPFLLGGVTGAALAPNFWRPNYGPRPFYPYPPYYGPFYR